MHRGQCGTRTRVPIRPHRGGSHPRSHSTVHSRGWAAHSLAPRYVCSGFPSRSATRIRSRCASCHAKSLSMLRGLSRGRRCCGVSGASRAWKWACVARLSMSIDSFLYFPVTPAVRVAADAPFQTPPLPPATGPSILACAGAGSAYLYWDLGMGPGAQAESLGGQEPQYSQVPVADAAISREAHRPAKEKGLASGFGLAQRRWPICQRRAHRWRPGGAHHVVVKAPGRSCNTHGRKGSECENPQDWNTPLGHASPAVRSHGGPASLVLSDCFSAALQALTRC